MSIEKQRRISIFEKIKHFFDTHTGFPQQIQEEIETLLPDDTMDPLDVIVKLLCTPEWGGETAATNFLSMLGVKEEEIDTLIAENLDYNL
jgi:hypothetical protein